MLSKSKLAGPLADRIDRLRGSLVALHRSVRDRVAEIIGVAVAEAVRDTVRAALDPPASAPPPPPRGRPTVRRAGPSPTSGPTKTRPATERMCGATPRRRPR